MELLEQRLAWIEPDHFERGSAVSVIERQKGGEGTATFTSPGNNQLLRFNLSEENRLRLLKQRKVADGVLLELGQDGHPVRLHLVELKGNVTTGKWREVKAQLLGALHNAHALMGLLGLPMPETVECHTLYQGPHQSPGKCAASIVQAWSWDEIAAPAGAGLAERLLRAQPGVSALSASQAPA